MILIPGPTTRAVLTSKKPVLYMDVAVEVVQAATAAASVNIRVFAALSS
jgi:hypothetical protein